jgi:hypothetical protein
MVSSNQTALYKSTKISFHILSQGGIASPSWNDASTIFQNYICPHPCPCLTLRNVDQFLGLFLSRCKLLKILLLSLNKHACKTISKDDTQICSLKDQQGFHKKFMDWLWHLHWILFVLFHTRNFEMYKMPLEYHQFVKYNMKKSQWFWVHEMQVRDPPGLSHYLIPKSIIRIFLDFKCGFINVETVVNALH